MQKAKELYQEYKKIETELVNQYCQIKLAKPLTPLPKLSKVIWRYQTLRFGWQEIAKKLSSNKFFQEG